MSTANRSLRVCRISAVLNSLVHLFLANISVDKLSVLFLITSSCFLSVNQSCSASCNIQRRYNPQYFCANFLAILRRYFRVRTMLNLRKSLFAHREQLKRECVISININDCRVK